MCDAAGNATPTVLIDNDRVRVTRWHFKGRGDNTGWHRHEYDYVVVPLFDGVLDIKLAGGETVDAQMLNGVPYYRELGVEHDVRNGNDFECAFVEIELLEPRGESGAGIADLLKA
ncbi:cupin domain-containing protein [Octadecabacter sp. G9-8]|uniref:Cupin domain-containing protein n=1 Tax=Octadecabacter dasysiphoniae TaxID=2909341 RepID=A0ABS9CYH4_9RHOB|nr:cupin domain-containing protein [Octadecabacter dasysiphoniae]MCF2872330.1 cupin domain-containing protein [Octadecabacter dasysiphoniae]